MGVLLGLSPKMGGIGCGECFEAERVWKWAFRTELLVWAGRLIT